MDSTWSPDCADAKLGLHLLADARPNRAALLEMLFSVDVSISALFFFRFQLRSMCKEGRKEASSFLPNQLLFMRRGKPAVAVVQETAKSYARTFARLFEEDRKAPSEMATQSYFDITKAQVCLLWRYHGDLV